VLNDPVNDFDPEGTNVLHSDPICVRSCRETLQSDIQSCAVGTSSAVAGVFYGCLLATFNVPGCAEAAGLYGVCGGGGCLITVGAKAVACVLRCPRAP
jgi:hypothetical protein